MFTVYDSTFGVFVYVLAFVVYIDLNIKPVSMTVSLNEIIPSMLTRQKVAMQTLLTLSAEHHSLIGNLETGNFFFVVLYLFHCRLNFTRFGGLHFVRSRLPPFAHPLHFTMQYHCKSI